MRTRRYSFKASGAVPDPDKAAALMKQNLNMGPESIIQYLCPDYIHQDDKDTVDAVSFVLDDGGRLSAVEITTYDWLYKQRKAEVTECMKLAAGHADPGIHIEGDMKFLRTEENLPEHFYHVTERKELDNILKEGLIPKRGHNDWRSKKTCVYLMEAQHIAPWLGILEHLEDPVLLEVETAKLASVEQGRIFEDRPYVPGRIYSEHRTTKPVPPEALRPMAPEEVAALGVCGRASAYLLASAVADLRDPERQSEANETKRCMSRLLEMGVMDEAAYQSSMKGFAEVSASADFARQVASLGQLSDGLAF